MKSEQYCLNYRNNVAGKVATVLAAPWGNSGISEIGLQGLLVHAVPRFPSHLRHADFAERHGCEDTIGSVQTPGFASCLDCAGRLEL